MIRNFRPGSMAIAVLTGLMLAVGVQLFTDNDLSLSRFFSSVNAAPQSSTGLLQQQNLVYEGAFRIPAGSVPGDAGGANFGGACMTHNPAGNNGQGSLLVCGFDPAFKVGEISIPAPKISTSMNSLPTATLISDFADVLQGHAVDIYGYAGASVNLGGLQLHNGKLVVSVYGYFDTDSASHPNSHFLASADLKNPKFLGGPYQVGNPAMPGFVAGFMAPIPAAFQGVLGGTHLTGQNSLPIIGRTSAGPSATVFNPANLGSTPAPAKRVLGYPVSNPTLGDWYGQGGSVMPRLWNGASRAVGAVFPEGSRSVLFFGVHGMGEFCYGDGTSNASLHKQPVPNEPGLMYCYDPTFTGKSPHAYPYKFFVWAYDANDLAAVKAGSKKDYEVLPYATWDFPLPIMAVIGNGTAPLYSLGSVTYDPVTQRIFMAQKFTDAGAATLINVFKVETGAVSGLCR